MRSLGLMLALWEDSVSLWAPAWRVVLVFLTSCCLRICFLAFLKNPIILFFSRARLILLSKSKFFPCLLHFFCPIDIQEGRGSFSYDVSWWERVQKKESALGWLSSYL